MALITWAIPPGPPTKRQTIFRWYFKSGFLVECRSDSSITHLSHLTNGTHKVTEKPQAKPRSGRWYYTGKLG